MKARISKIMILIVVLALILPLFFGPGLDHASAKGEIPPTVDFYLTILHNNDGESQVINAGQGLEDFGGVARFTTLVQKLKCIAYLRRGADGGANRGMVMLSSGDNFLAGPEFSASLAKGIPFYDALAMRFIGYDAINFGNHDFDFGPEVLADFLASYGFRGPPPYVAANLDFSGEPVLQAYVDKGVIVPATIIWERGEKIGVIGIMTPNLPFISSPRNVTVDPALAENVQAQVDWLEAQGVNKIILTGHLQSINEDIELAALLDGVDVIIAGGGDELLANEDDLLIPGDEANVFGSYPQIANDMDGDVIYIVTTPGEYRYVGQLVVGFDKQGNIIKIDKNRSGLKRVATDDCNGNLPCNDTVLPAPMVQKMVVDPIEAYVASLAENVIGTSEVELDGLRGSVRTIETNEGNLVADSLLWQATQLAGDFGLQPPDVALQNGGGIRNNTIIPVGDITELTTFDILPFSNFVSIVEGIPREQFKEILENAVSNVENVDGRFAQISGFRFTWDPAGTPQELDDDGNVTVPGTRVIDVTLDDGTVIVEDGSVVAGDPLNIATIDFLARGGDRYPFRGAPFTTVGVSYQQALSNYIQDGLSGVISAADYPEGGEGRITEVGAVASIPTVGSIFTGQTVFMPLTNANW